MFRGIRLAAKARLARVGIVLAAAFERDNLPGEAPGPSQASLRMWLQPGASLAQAEARKNASGVGVNPSQYVLEPLRMDEEFVLYRAEQSSERGLPSVLVLAPASKHPPLATLKKIKHEYQPLLSSCAGIDAENPAQCKWRRRVTVSGRLAADNASETGRPARRGSDGPGVVLDLKNVVLVDHDIVRFLLACQSDGIALRNCPPHIREWIAREEPAATVQVPRP